MKNMSNYILLQPFCIHFTPVRSSFSRCHEIDAVFFFLKQKIFPTLKFKVSMMVFYLFFLSPKVKNSFGILNYFAGTTNWNALSQFPHAFPSRRVHFLWPQFSLSAKEKYWEAINMLNYKVFI